MSATASASSSVKWLRPDAPGVTYTAVGPQKAVPVAESSSTLPSVPKLSRTLKLIREPGRPVLRIHREPFFVERDENVYYIRHEKWSLLGSGDSLAAAYKDLFDEAVEVAPVYTNTPLSHLDYEGTRLARFLLRFR